MNTTNEELYIIQNFQIVGIEKFVLLMIFP